MREKKPKTSVHCADVVWSGYWRNAVKSGAMRQIEIGCPLSNAISWKEQELNFPARGFKLFKDEPEQMDTGIEFLRGDPRGHSGVLGSGEELVSPGCPLHDGDLGDDGRIRRYRTTDSHRSITGRLPDGHGLQLDRRPDQHHHR